MAASSIDDVIPLHVADFRIQPLPDHDPLSHLGGTIGTVLAFAIVQSRGITLYETGVGRAHLPTVSSRFGAAVHQHYEVAPRPIEDELDRHGIAIGDVRAIVNSHLHWDHCGGNPLFPGVPIYVQTVEYEAAQRGGREYTVPDWVDFPGAALVTIDGDAPVSDGIRILSTPGHTSGHQTLVVETGRAR